VIDPLGNCTTQTWEDGFTTGLQDANGNQTTYTYATLSNGLKLVESVENGSGRFGSFPIRCNQICIA
jgi:TnpA family transposase